MSRCEREAENVQFKSGLNFYQIWSFRRLIYMKCGKNICDANIRNKFMRNGHQSIKPLLVKSKATKVERQPHQKHENQMVVIYANLSLTNVFFVFAEIVNVKLW